MEQLDIPNKIDLTKYDLLDHDIIDHINKCGKEIYVAAGKNK